MKVRNQWVAHALHCFGWTILERGEETMVTGWLREDQAGTGMHDFYYGPMPQMGVKEYIILKRPKGLSRSDQKRVFRTLMIVYALYESGEDNSDLAGELMTRLETDVETLKS